MRFIRLLGALVIFYGFSYLMYGLRQHFGLVGYQADNYISTLNLNIGAVTLAIGIGLVLAKEWARIAWLSSVTLLLSMHVFFLAVSYLGALDLTLQTLNVVLIVLLFLISWSRLSRANVKPLFH
jgi:hypothetical protein